MFQQKTMYLLHFHVPSAYCESVKEAMFATGAGKQGNYEHCSWQTLGKGQFKPLKKSQPFIGSHHKLEIVDEYRVEMICAQSYLKSAIDALIAQHPYEHPAYAIIELQNFEESGS